MAVFEAGSWAIDHASQIEIPMLVVHGTADQLTSHDASERFVKNSNSRADLISMEGGYHELHNDLDRDQFIRTIVDWLKRQLR